MTDDRLLDLPPLPADDRLHRVVDAALAAAGPPPRPREVRSDLWDAAFFGLDRATAFRSATPGQQRHILSAAGRALLEEAWHVEQCGVAYAARGALRAQSREERALYALFAADEARHLHAVGGWLADDAVGPPSAFHHLLADVHARAEPTAAVLIVQVVLEGWGLRHYRDLARACADPDLTAVLDGIVSDETRHHGSGVILLGQRAPDPAGWDTTIELLSTFLDMVRAGPVGTLAAVEAVLGPLSRADRLQTLHELDATGHAASRLALLHQLMGVRHALPVRDALEAAGRFTPLPPESVA